MKRQSCPSGGERSMYCHESWLNLLETPGPRGVVTSFVGFRQTATFWSCMPSGNVRIIGTMERSANMQSSILLLCGRRRFTSHCEKPRRVLHGILKISLLRYGRRKGHRMWLRNIQIYSCVRSRTFQDFCIEREPSIEGTVISENVRAQY